jgi:uncharacterized membrane protein YqjE
MADWEGQTLLARDGEKVGTIKEIFVVEEAGGPEWALVKLGRIKGRTTLVPLTQAQPVDAGVKIGYEKDAISEAPEVDADSEPSEQQVNALYRHYGIDLNHGATNGSNGHGHATAEVLRDEPIGDLLKQVSDKGSTLVQQELQLAKAEMGEKAKQVGIGAGMFGGAGYVAHLASIALMLTLIFGLAEAMRPWLAALIVTVVYGAIAAVLALQAKKKIQDAGPPIPEQAIESVKQTIDTVKEEAKWGLGQTR